MAQELCSLQWPAALPATLGELYDFYIDKVQSNVATERVLVQRLQSVSRLTRHRLWSSFVFVFVFLLVLSRQCVNFFIDAVLFLPPLKEKNSFTHKNLSSFLFPLSSSFSRDDEQNSLFGRFVHGTDEFRNARFKLIPHVALGPWVVQRAVGTKPLIVGKALKVAYHTKPNYMEVDIDIGSSTVANNVVRFVLGCAHARPNARTVPFSPHPPPLFFPPPFFLAFPTTKSSLWQHH